jgi:hypothetical protein
MRGCAAAKPIATRVSQISVNFFLLWLDRRNRTHVAGVWQKWRMAPVLPSMGPDMSPVLPISFVVTLLCVLVAIDWALYQQILFVGAALSATVWACSLEAWSCQGAPVRSEDERGQSYPADE